MAVRRIAPILAGGLLFALSASTSATADPDGCRNAIDSYNGAVGEIGSTMRRYTNCVSGSQGKDDCSFEFRRLKRAQDDFEMAVSAYRTDCD